MSTKSEDQMVQGYLCGYNGADGALPACYAKRSPAFKHGWNNGRDDRLGKPSEKAAVLRARSGMILSEFTSEVACALTPR
jgi:hypothetical protein